MTDPHRIHDRQHRQHRHLRAYRSLTAGTARLIAPSPPPGPPRRLRGDAGQATTEYALVLLAAALIGLLAVAWATAGGGAGRIGELFDRVLDSIIDRV
jgi:hypothetical protein